MNIIFGFNFNTQKVNSHNNIIFKKNSNDLTIQGISGNRTPFLLSHYEVEGVTIALTGYLDGMGCSSSASAQFLLREYLSSGESVVNKKNGSFSAIIIDGRQNNKCLLFTDTSNQRRWYYYYDNEKFAFSSKLKYCSLISGQHSFEIDESDFFWIYGFLPENKTVYKNIFSLSHKKYAVYDTDTGLQIKSKDFITTLPSPKIQNETDATSTLEKLLINATLNNCINEKKVGVLLGGFDSALVASLLKHTGKEVETFSFYYDDIKYNQAHTDTLANYLNIKHHWIKIDESVIYNGLSNFADKFDQPTNWPNYLIQTEHVCQKIKSFGINVCFTGDGCDNLFYGYPGVFKNAKLYSNLGRIPNFLMRAIEILFNNGFVERQIGHPYRLLMRLCRNMNKDFPERAYLMFRIFDELTIVHLFNRNLNKIKRNVKQTEYILCRDLPLKSAPWLAYQGKAAISPNRTKLIGSSDSADIAIFSPYMDATVKDFVVSLPENYLRPSGDIEDIGKYILTKMAQEKNYLPANIIYQPKMAAVDAPIDKWYKTTLMPTTKTLILKGFPNISKRGLNALFKETPFEKLYRKAFNRSDNLTTHVLSLLATSSTYREDNQ